MSQNIENRPDLYSSGGMITTLYTRQQVDAEKMRADEHFQILEVLAVEIMSSKKFRPRNGRMPEIKFDFNRWTPVLYLGGNVEITALFKNPKWRFQIGFSLPDFAPCFSVATLSGVDAVKFIINSAANGGFEDDSFPRIRPTGIEKFLELKHIDFNEKNNN